MEDPECCGRAGYRSLVQEQPEGMELVKRRNSSRLKGTTVVNRTEGRERACASEQGLSQSRLHVSGSAWTEQLVTGQINVREITQRRITRQESSEQSTVAPPPVFHASKYSHMSKRGTEGKTGSIRRSSASPHRVHGRDDSGGVHSFKAKGGAHKSCNSGATGVAGKQSTTDIAKENGFMANLSSNHGMVDEIKYEVQHQVSPFQPRIARDLRHAELGA